MSGADTTNELQTLATSLARARGDAFFPALARYLARSLDAARVLVTESVDDARARTLAVFADGNALPNYEFALDGTPCQAVLAGATLQMETALAERFPRGALGFQGYFGVPITSADGEVLGHLCAFGTHQLPVSAAQRLSCEMLAARASAELQQLAASSRLRDLERHQQLLEARNRHLEDEIKLLEREQVAGAASGVHRVPSFADIDLDSENTGLHHVQREHILRVLNATHWVIEGNSGAALKLGMKPATLRHRMKKLGIARARPTG
jgi:transcriptional regulator with GAF, ATPase, and Fis domain